MSSLIHIAARELSNKLEDPAVYKEWVDATLPFMESFLRSRGIGWIWKITVVNADSSDVVPPTEPRGDEKSDELKLVRSDDYRFRLFSSSKCEDDALWDDLDFPWTTLFRCLVDHLQANQATVGDGSVMHLLCEFDRFTKSETECGKIVRRILGESSPPPAPQRPDKKAALFDKLRQLLSRQPQSSSGSS